MPTLRRQGGATVTDTCSHLGNIEEVTPRTMGCEECLQTGDSWVELRLCMTCGHVGCCDSSKNEHATAHFRATGHPIMKSFEPGGNWGWCYIDEERLEAVSWPIRGPASHGERPAA